jgi:hypothetical protein
LFGVREIKEGFKESRHSFPAIASHVTAFGRLALWRYIVKAGVANVFYCDTDSLLTNEIGLARLKADIDLTRLGSLSIDGEYDSVNIKGLKDYEFDNTKRLKGIRLGAVQLDEVTYKQESWQSLKTALANPEPGTFVVKIIEKKLNRDYRKGNVSTNGLVTPLVLGLPSDADV